ncbi:MAG: hypothetical protein N2558_02110 [Patescibacteria group bacterium]|nr:hypothetical protein [Patescibacteria group bacterium]
MLDSGGTHSVAMAVKLAESGYQPIVMLDAIVHPKGIVRAEQDLAVLLYFAGEMEKLKTEGKITDTSSPVFVLNCHRIGFCESLFDNSYTFTNKDFPNAKELKANSITCVVYLNETNQNGYILPDFQAIDRVSDDLQPLIMDWQANGIQVLYSGVYPWPNDPQLPKPIEFIRTYQIHNQSDTTITKNCAREIKW